ncbi:MAG: hypothetical protein ACM335_11155 [Deltaproteobacteria bacterium]
MKHGRVIIGVGLCALIFFLFCNAGEARAATFYGTIVAIEGTALQVKGSNGGVSLFWVGRKTQFKPRAPLFGDRVKIEYVIDKLRRRAVTHLTVLEK